MPKSRSTSEWEKSISEWEMLAALGAKGHSITAEEVRQIIKKLPSLFKQHLISNGIDPKQAQALVTKFRDAGRRSAPWMAFSSKVPGRPQDGKDGNRINRWLLPSDHKYYADERTATLVEIKYFLQTLAMSNAPAVPSEKFNIEFSWLTGFKIEPGSYQDPVTLMPVDFFEVVAEPRNITSGHIYPLDRGGKHVPENTFLITRTANMLQGNNTVPELLEIMEGIVARHKARKKS